MIYVSCNPVTLARDLFQLKNSGFEVKAVEGFAFYPHTPHLEMLLVLDRG
jgi:23S rRNA (uracil1939-C5)-methyltransferase